MPLDDTFRKSGVICGFSLLILIINIYELERMTVKINVFFFDSTAVTDRAELRVTHILTAFSYFDH